MADLRSEEEQLDVIKRWWKDNGVSLIAGVALAAAGVFGWHAWQNHQEGQAAAASARYQQLMALSSQPTLADEQRATAHELAGEIADDYGNTLYADLALLQDARLAAQQGDYDAARNSLSRVAEGSSRRYLQSLAWLRLARVETAAGDPERALELLDEPISAALSAQQAEARGDAYAALDRSDEARTAWQEAIELAQTHDQPLYGVQFKLDDLGAEEAM